MLDKQRILVIDDDKFIQKVLVKSLRDDYDTEVASSGEQGIAMAQRYKPHVILLDVEMPGQNGYEVCDSLKHEAVTCDIPVVFLSSHSSLRERMLGYEVGGQDYLVKPFELEELRAKLGKITGAQAENLSLRSSAASAQNTAMEAMTSSFELGRSVRFVENSYQISSFSDLAQLLGEFCSGLELSAAMMFQSRKGPLFFSNTASTASPLECEILEMLHLKDRFVDFGCRTQVNYPHISILIKNMPLEDRAR